MLNLIKFKFSSFEELSHYNYTPVSFNDYERIEINLDIGVELSVDCFGLVWTGAGRNIAKVEEI